jgi:hypothetical protein
MSDGVIMSDTLLRALATMADGDRTSYAPVVVDTGNDHIGY